MTRAYRLSALLAMSLVAFVPAATAADWYVATNGTGDGTSWADATNSIQGAINASSAADTVWVSNGVYQTGGVTNYPAGTVLTNRIAIYKAITVRSADNNPTNTIIKGAGPNGPAAVRCVYMTNGSALIGFTLTNGATLAAGAANNRYGGGVWSQSTNTVISNCVIAGNSATNYGGGAYYGTLFNCMLTGNSAIYAGGTAYGTHYNCTIVGNSATNGGGGTYYGTLYNCTIASNSTIPGTGGGGGVWYGTLYNCTLTGNSSPNGGGAYFATLFNCTIVGNSGTWGGGAQNGTLYNCTLTGNSASSRGGGVYDGTLYNCIVYFNTAITSGSNWFGTVSFTNSCTTTAQVGWASGNITSNPMFIANGSGYGTNHVAGNYRLRGNSPAINAGTNFSWMTNSADVRSKDLDGRPRIRGGQVDMGCYEFMGSGTMFAVY